jgi:hypothetical protein
MFHVEWILSTYDSSPCDASLCRSLIYIDDQRLQRSVEILEILTITYEIVKKLPAFVERVAA